MKTAFRGILKEKAKEGTKMFCTKKHEKMMGMKKTSAGGAMLLGAMLGVAATAIFCNMKKIKKKCGCISDAVQKCGCDGTDNTYENFCECNVDPDGHSDLERARNGFDCHGEAEECDTDILHSHGCLGYPHDNYGGFANSNGDRPNDTSNPEIDNQKGIPEGNTSPYWEKNAQGKSNPQPENKVTEVKKQKK